MLEYVTDAEVNSTLLATTIIVGILSKIEIVRPKNPKTLNFLVSTVEDSLESGITRSRLTYCVITCILMVIHSWTMNGRRGKVHLMLRLYIFIATRFLALRA